MNKVLCVLLIVLLFATGCASTEKSDEQYRRDLVSVVALMAENLPYAEDMVSRYSKLWRYSIEHDTSNRVWFGEGLGISEGDVIKYINLREIWNAESALKQAHNYFEGKGMNKKLEDGLNETSAVMKKLNNPPKDYEKVHNEMLELYSLYNKYISLALSPTGSLISYNNTTNQLSSDIITKIKEIDVIMPDSD